MPVNVLIPSPLRKLVGDVDTVVVSSGTVGSALDEINGKHDGFSGRVQDDAGNIRKFVNVYLNGEDVRFLQGKETVTNDGDTISIVPAIAGGKK